VSVASFDLLSFRRAFVLLLLLVVLPACGLAAFGVVAIGGAAPLPGLPAIAVPHVQQITQK